MGNESNQPTDAENQEVADLKRQMKKYQEEKEQLKDKIKELKEENLMLKEEKLPGPATIQLPQANFPNIKPPPIKPATSPQLIKPAVYQPSQKPSVKPAVSNSNPNINNQGQKKEEELKVNVPKK